MIMTMNNMKKIQQKNNWNLNEISITSDETTF